MKTFIIATLLAITVCQGADAQWKNKHGFCGAPLKKWQLKDIVPQAQFLQLRENDTIADIGASSGWFQGALANASPIEKLNFVLVDIDSTCLNMENLVNMTKYYVGLKGSSIKYRYELHVNNEKSLQLDGRKFAKILVRNTLHEVADKENLAREISNALYETGEVYIIEVLPTEKRKNHGGCHLPLLTATEINSLFERHGMKLKDQQVQVLNKKISLQFLKFGKTI